MSKPFANPFFEADMSKMFDMSKMSGNFQMPQVDMEAAFSLQRKNMEACTALGQAAFENFQSLYQRQADLMRQMMEEASQTMQSVMSCPTPEEKIIKQAEASKAAMDKCLSNVRDISETVSKCSNQALETVSTRMNEGLDEWRGLIKTRPAA